MSVEKHGINTRRSWRKLHIGSDADTGQIVAARLTTTEVDDGAEVGPLLDQVSGHVASFTDNGFKVVPACGMYCCYRSYSTFVGGIFGANFRATKRFGDWGHLDSWYPVLKPRFRRQIVLIKRVVPDNTLGGTGGFEGCKVTPRSSTSILASG